MVSDQILQSIFNPHNQAEQQAFLKQSLHESNFEYYFYIQNLPFPFNNTESQFLCASNLPHSDLKNLQDGITLKNNPLDHLNPALTTQFNTFTWNRHNLSNHPDLLRLFKDFPQLYGLILPHQNISGSKNSSLVLLRSSHPVSIDEIKQQLFYLKHLVFSANYLIKQRIINHYLNTTHPPLPPRQAQISRCIATGMSNAEIADHLKLKPNTVIYHVRQILRNTQSLRRTPAALKALLPELLN
ncbi:MAG: LuxR C-terminal-related transcriptional regulator [Advenella sp.]|nr:LuxR C-terminal-related transcriptional regulator [Advenella sp.]